MALATCSSCGHKVSTTARACPKCGAPPPKLIYCTRCGGDTLDTESICPECGAARYEDPPGSLANQGNPSTVNQPTAVLPPRSTKEAAARQAQWQCPKCNSENIQKLSVIYSEGSTSSTQTVMAAGIGDSSHRGGIGGAVGQVSGTSSSILAMNVAPPTEPKRPDGTPAGCATAVVVLILSFVTSWVIFSVFFSGPEFVSPSSSDTVSGGDVLAFLFFIVVLPVALAIFAGGQVRRSLERSQQTEYPNKLSAYNQAMAKWQSSYFCHRCGNIFEMQS